ncbi:MAG: hypothetical protein RIC87_12610 [Kiloniellales bacterium]
MTAIALEAARTYDAAFEMDKAAVAARRQKRTAHRFEDKERNCHARAEALRKAALCLPASTPFEAMAQIVLVSDDVEQMLDHKETKAEGIRAMHALESVLRVLENITGDSRLALGSYGQGAYDIAPFDTTVEEVVA